METLTFALPDGTGFTIRKSWWLETGMLAFRPTGLSYRVQPDLHGRPHFLVDIASITPFDLSRRHTATGGFDEARFINVLRRFVSDTAMPPVEVVERPSGAFLYKLTNGAHRFHASAAAGFLMIPAVIGWVSETGEPPS